MEFSFGNWGNTKKIGGLKISIITLGLLLLFSCRKEEKRAYKYAGTWEIKSIEVKNYTDRGKTVSSTKTLTNPGTMLLVNTTDNDFDIENQYCKFTFTGEIPQSIVNFCARAGLTAKEFEAHYSAGPHSNDRLTIWAELALLHELEIYTVKKITRDKLELNFVGTDINGDMIYEESWSCDIKN